MKRKSVRGKWTSPMAIGIYIAVITTLLHLIFNANYGYFRDELYLLDASRHLDFGYVDFAPLFAFIARIYTSAFGTSLFAIRSFSALAGGFTVLLIAIIINELGGKRFSVIIGCICAAFSPTFLVLDTLFSMNALEPIFWLLCVYFIILSIKRKEPRYWILVGISAGLGIMNKHSTTIFIIGILIGLLLTKNRTIFANKWFYLAGLIGFLIILPNIIWQFNHDFATYQDLKNVKETGKNVRASPLGFILEQIFYLNPLAIIIWVLGIWYFLFIAKEYRIFAYAYLSVLLIWMTLSGKFYYVIPAYPMLFAGGAVYFEKIKIRWVKYSYLALFIISALIIMPIALPILPPGSLIKYQNNIGIEPPKTEVGHIGPLPQHFGDMFGWPEMVSKVAKVYYNLTPEERSKAGILAGNYGEAGAVNLFGPRLGLPHAVSGHQNYYFWGPGNYTGEVLILLQFDKSLAQKYCKSVEDGEIVYNQYSMEEEHFTILVCKGLSKPLKELWPDLKHWN